MRAPRRQTLPARLAARSTAPGHDQVCAALDRRKATSGNSTEPASPGAGAGASGAPTPAAPRTADDLDPGVQRFLRFAVETAIRLLLEERASARRSDGRRDDIHEDDE